jgi:hypothetical protein
MNTPKKIIRKCSLVMATSLLGTALLSQPAYAQSEGVIISLLASIQNITHSILVQIQQTPAYFEAITQMAVSWIETKDPANTIANNQFAFAELNTNYAANVDAQKALTQDLTLQFLSNNGNLNPPENTNELSATVLWGQMLVKQSDADKKAKKDINVYTKNYITNLTGANFILDRPNPVLGKKTDSAIKYINFYNTLSAVQSYNTYVLGGLLKQQTEEAPSTYLMNQASSSDWFTQVATEPLGLVLRQILMYSSQNYVQLERLVKLQRQQVAEQAMTNTLLIMNNGQSIGQLLMTQAKQAISQDDN